jgi:hypothetical protein
VFSAGLTFGEIMLSGSTDGCFGTGCTPVANASIHDGAGDNFIFYINNTFSGTTSGGSLDLNGSNGLGTFEYISNTLSSPFTLLVTLTGPFSETHTFTGTLTADGSTANITFGGESFTFSDGNGTSFLLTPHDVSEGSVVGSGSVTPITATISNAQSPASATPEPSSYLLVGAGVALMIWRRSSSARAA